VGDIYGVGWQVCTIREGGREGGRDDGWKDDVFEGRTMRDAENGRE